MAKYALAAIYLTSTTTVAAAVKDLESKGQWEHFCDLSGILTGDSPAVIMAAVMGADWDEVDAEYQMDCQATLENTETYYDNK